MLFKFVATNSRLSQQLVSLLKSTAVRFCGALSLCIFFDVLFFSPYFGSTGTVVYDKPAFHDERSIYPVGFFSTCLFKAGGDVDLKFLNEIADGGSLPVFRVRQWDDSGEMSLLLNRFHLFMLRISR